MLLRRTARIVGDRTTVECLRTGLDPSHVCGTVPKVGQEFDGSSFIIGYLLGRRRSGADPLAITPGQPSTTPRSWRWAAAAMAIGASLVVALLWWDLTTGVGWLRTAVLALVAAGAAIWLVETLWERRRSGAITDEAQVSE